MGGKSGGSPKMKVTRYYLSLHIGICQGPVDAIKAVWVGEKVAWEGNATGNSAIFIRRENLFGGMKKEGGVMGAISMLFGGPTQTMPPPVTKRIDSQYGLPGFRGITSLFFNGPGGDNLSDYDFGGLFGNFATLLVSRTRGRAFYWGTQPYLKPVWVTVERIPARALAPQTAPIPAGGYRAFSLCLCLDQSGSMLDTVSGSKTRMDVQKEEVVAALQDTRGSLVATRGSLGIVGYGLLDGSGSPLPQTFFRYGVTSGDVDDAIAFVEALYAQVQSDTDWAVGMEYAANFHLTASTTPVTIFITDGSPGRVGASQQTVIDDTIAERDRVGDHRVYGVGIDLSTTSYLVEVDNTPDDGVPNVTSASGGAVRDAILAALQDFLTFNANPAHIIYECLTNTDWGMGADPASIDTASFVSASQTLYDEVFGVFMQWQAQSSIEDFVNNVLDHIKGAIFPHPRTGKMTLRLLRDDLDVPNLKEITPDNAAMANFSRKGWGETTNEIVVNWTNPETEKEETVRIQDLANVAQQGGVVSGSKNYHGIRAASLAIQVAERDLREESAPLSSCEVEVNREFWDATPFEGVKVTWPEYGLNTLVMRVMKVNYGDSANSTVKLSLLEDVFSLPVASYVAPADGEWQDPAASPTPVSEVRFMPVPAYAVSQAGYDLAGTVYPATGVTPLAVNPTTSNAAHFQTLEQATTLSGDAYWDEIGGEREFVGLAELTNELLLVSSSPSVVLTNTSGLGATRDTILLIGDGTLPDDDLELALVTAVDGTDGSLTLLRGVLDTVPKKWPAGTRVTVTSGSMWAPLPREYTDQQSVTLRFLTGTSGGMLEEYQAPDFTATAEVRSVLPTRPGNLRAFGELAPDPAVYPTYPVTVTWSHRNRLLEDNILLAWDAGDVSVEPGVTYRVLVEAIQEDGTLDGVAADVTQATTTYDVTEALLGPALAGSPFVRVSVWALRDGLQSWQAGQVTFRGPFRAPVIQYGAYRDPQAPGNVAATIVP